MSTFGSRSLVRAIFVSTLVAGAICSTQLSAAPAGPAGCNAAAHEWVAAQGGDLPRTYEEFVRFPLNYRKAIYSKLSPETKSALWRQQIEQALNGNGLTDSQREILLEALQLADSNLFAVSKDKENWRYRQSRHTVAEFEARARAAFGYEAARGIFSRIGPADSETLYFVDRNKAEMVDNRLKSIVEPMAAAYCSCSDASDWCGHGNCTTGGCTRIEDECGTWWTYACDGLCVQTQ